MYNKNSHTGELLQKRKLKNQRSDLNTDSCSYKKLCLRNCLFADSVIIMYYDQFIATAVGPSIKLNKIHTESMSQVRKCLSDC